MLGLFLERTHYDSEFFNTILWELCCKVQIPVNILPCRTRCPAIDFIILKDTKFFLPNLSQVLFYKILLSRMTSWDRARYFSRFLFFLIYYRASCLLTCIQHISFWWIVNSLWPQKRRLWIAHETFNQTKTNISKRIKNLINKLQRKKSIEYYKEG